MHFERFTDRARRSIVLGQEQARLLKHNYIGTEHLLLGLLALGEGIAHEVLERLDVSLAAARDKIVEMIGEGHQAPQGHIPFTPRAKKVLQLSMREALALQHNYIGTEHVLLGLIREKSGVAWQALEALGLKSKATRDAVIETVRGLGPTQTSATDPTDDVLRRLVDLEVRIETLEKDDE
ncbi:MAG: Clp protease N-terminal domain-containing protein [Actinomycetota bacterium]